MSEAAPPGRERRSPTPAAARKRAAIRHLKAALAGERVLLHYQPIVRVSDGVVERVESLLRWRKPEQETATLTDLVWLAERSPVIYKLENWILDQAFRDAAGWPALHEQGRRLHVNVSAREFPRADLVRRLGRLLRRAGLQPADVALEITETSGMRQLEEVAEQLGRLIDMGVELWLDDFGTGHSSLEWLSHLPLHGIKIAGTFVERLGDDTRCAAILTRLLELAHDLGLRVIAEGVETEAQRDFLERRRCHLLQGFLFHAPLPAHRVPEALQAPAAVTSTP